MPALRNRFRAASHAVMAALRFLNTPQRKADRRMPAENSSQRKASRFRPAGLAIIATLRFQNTLHSKARRPGMPAEDTAERKASRFRAAGQAIIATLRFRDMRPQSRAPRSMLAEDMSQLKVSRFRAACHVVIAALRFKDTPQSKACLRMPAENTRQKKASHFRSYGYVLVFTSFLTSKLHEIHRQCLTPLNKALEIIVNCQSFKLDQALNAGKCKVLVELFSSIGNRLGNVKFVLQNLKSPPEAVAYEPLSACYYTLKGLCRLLLMSQQYIQDCTGFLPSRQVFAKLENIKTIKFLLLEVYKTYQLFTIKFEEFLSCINDVSVQEFSWNCKPPSSPGLYMGHHLQLQAENDLTRVLDNLRQHPKLSWAGFMRNRKNTLTAAEDEALRELLLARLSYSKEELGNVEFLKKGLLIESSYVKIGKRIGSGSYGDVDEVICFGEKYAMKTIKGISAIEDANEAVIQASLDHPNIVKLVWYSSSTDNSQGSLFLLLDLMSSSLENFLKNQPVHKRKGLAGSCPLIAVNIMMQIARAMQYLHSEEIMHRDLKAANVLVDHTMNPDAFDEGYVHVKLADFGFAKVKKKGSKTMNSWKMGTKYWRAPEVLIWKASRTINMTGGSNIYMQGSSTVHLAKYSYPADVYSFAMTCYEIVTGKTPFQDDLATGGLQEYPTLKESIVNLHKRPSLPEDLYPPLKSLIEECWDGRPEKRPSFEAIYDRLDQIKDELMFGSLPVLD